MDYNAMFQTVRCGLHFFIQNVLFANKTEAVLHFIFLKEKKKKKEKHLLPKLLFKSFHAVTTVSEHCTLQLHLV